MKDLKVVCDRGQKTGGQGIEVRSPAQARLHELRTRMENEKAALTLMGALLSFGDGVRYDVLARIGRHVDAGFPIPPLVEQHLLAVVEVDGIMIPEPFSLCGQEVTHALLKMSVGGLSNARKPQAYRLIQEWDKYQWSQEEWLEAESLWEESLLGKDWMKRCRK